GSRIAVRKITALKRLKLISNTETVVANGFMNSIMGHHTSAYSPTPMAAMITNLQQNFYTQLAQQQHLSATTIAQPNTPANGPLPLHQH
ncbi:hypothetical protein DOY81_015408, partial [Sarcophaga bullata]